MFKHGSSQSATMCSGHYMVYPILAHRPAVKPPINNIAGSSVMLANTYYNTILMAVLSMVVIGKK